MDGLLSVRGELLQTSVSTPYSPAPMRLQSVRKVIEVDFLPRLSESISAWSNSIGRASFNGTRRVLVIDNDRETTRLIKILLESKGDYFVLAENDPAKAHQTARDFRPDVILLDIVMPDTDGGEVAARIRNDADLRQTPVIFVTALVTKSEAKNGFQIGDHSFLAKPVDFSELLGTIDRHLEARVKPDKHRFQAESGN